MKQLALIIAFASLACQNPQQLSQAGDEKITMKTETSQSDEDTTLEKNDPKQLDLSRHQMFLDTTRSSLFYERLKNWKPSESVDHAIQSSLNQLTSAKIPAINTKDFPRKFITVRKLKGQFVLYYRCNGIDPRFEIRNAAFIFYGPLEHEAEPIVKLMALRDGFIKLQLKTYESKSADQKAEVLIEKTGMQDIYKLSYQSGLSSWTEFVTAVENIEKFDLLVNNCVEMMRPEYSGFE